MQRSMGILVAAEASLELVVRLARMAVVALWDRLLDNRRMTDVAAGTPDVLVFFSGGCQISRRRGMTFRTVVV